MSRKLEMGVRLGFTRHSGVDGNTTIIPTINITDRSSGIEFCEVRLTAEQWTEICSNSMITTEVEIPDPEVLARIGKTQQNELVKVPDEIAKLQGYKSEHTDMQWLWLEDQRVKGNWDTASFRKQNNGLHAVFYRWVDEPETDVF